MTRQQHTPSGTPVPSEVVIPAPRGPAEPTRGHGMLTEGAPRSVRDQPGWVSLVEALDHTVAAMVAGLEHRLCCADADTAAKLRHQLDRARRLEATTAAAAASARHTHPAPAPVHEPVPAAGTDQH